MKSKLVFRILGALASALIIASVFIPFVSVLGYSQSLWETHNAVGTIYLPIMIIVFGAVGVLVFSTGFKTELAYASAGGLLFFLIMQTIPIINQGTFSTLGVGYYCLAIGTCLIIIMAFICGLKVKPKVVKETVVEETKQVSMIDQIDKLYNDQTENQNINEPNSLDNIIQPLPIGAVSHMPVQNSVQFENNIQPQMTTPSSEPVSLQNLSPVNSQPMPNTEIITQDVNNTIPSVQLENNIVAVQSSANMTNIQEQPTNSTEPQFNSPVMQSVETNTTKNLATAEFSIPSQNIAIEEANTSNIQNQTMNPVVSEFGAPVVQEQQNNNSVNPVTAEFSSQVPEQSSFLSSNNFTAQPVNENISNEVNTVEEIKPLDIDKKFDVMGEQTNNSSNLDIFG